MELKVKGDVDGSKVKRHCIPNGLGIIITNDDGVVLTKGKTNNIDNMIINFWG